MKNRFKNVKVGQKVWSFQFGKGEMYMNTNEKIYVEFHEKAFPNRAFTITYTHGGKIADRDKTPDLYLKKPIIMRKARLKELTDKAFFGGRYRWRMEGFREAKRIHDLELKEYQAETAKKIELMAADYVDLQSAVSGADKEVTPDQISTEANKRYPIFSGDLSQDLYNAFEEGAEYALQFKATPEKVITDQEIEQMFSHFVPSAASIMIRGVKIYIEMLKQKP